jgi:hypothetical protein
MKRAHTVESSQRGRLPSPISLIDISEHGALTLNEEARRMLCSEGTLGRPLMVVCVVGRSRTGKSFLLNRMLMNHVGSGKGFEVSASTRACTKGLWIAGKPIPAPLFWSELGIEPPSDHEDTQSPYDVLVVDTEGINALDRDQSYDMRIFTLALLLSSVFVFNSLGAIDENAISTLSAVASVAETIRSPAHSRRRGLREAGDSAAPASQTAPTVPLLWVVRDFNLTHDTRDNQAAADDDDDAYLEAALANPDEGTLDRLRAGKKSSKQEMRAMLARAFPVRSCQTMVRPAEREDDMKQLQDLPNDMLRPEFVAQMQSFRKKLSRMARVKHDVDPATLCDLIEKYLVSINNDAVPVVADVWTQVARQRCERILNESMRPLESLVTSSPPSLLANPCILYTHVRAALDYIESSRDFNHSWASFAGEFNRQLQQRCLVALKTLTVNCRSARQEPKQQLASPPPEVYVPPDSKSPLTSFLNDASAELRALVAEQLSEASRGSSIPELELKTLELQAAEKELAEMRALWMQVGRDRDEARQELTRVLDKLQESELARAAVEAASGGPEAGLKGSSEEFSREEYSNLEDRLKEEQQKVAAAYEEDLDEMDRRLSSAEKALEECAAEKQRVSLQLDMTSLRLRENTVENTRLRDQLGAKAAEVSRLIDDHGRARLEWATRLRESETLAAKAQGLSESLTSRLQSLESIQSTLAACREKLHEHEIALARVQAERDAARQLAERTQATLARQEQELFDGLKTLRDMQRTLRRG